MALGKGTIVEIVAAPSMDTWDATEYGEQTYVKVGDIESVSPFGGTSQVTTFIPIETGDIDKDIGSTNFGTLTLTMREKLADAGQLALKAGFDGANKGVGFAVKMTVPIGGGATAIRYTYGKISSFEGGPSDADSNVMVTCAIELTKPRIPAA